MTNRATQNALSAKFAPTKFNTAADKSKFVKTFITFFEDGCNPRKFTKPFYRELRNTFQQIAHYDLSGFWYSVLENPSKQYEFLKHVSQCPIYGDPQYTFSDAESVLQTWVRESGILGEYEQKQADYLG